MASSSWMSHTLKPMMYGIKQYSFLIQNYSVCVQPGTAVTPRRDRQDTWMMYGRAFGDGLRQQPYE